MFDLGGDTTRPRLFNWMTVVLVSGWVLLVSVLAETTQPVAHAATVDEFVSQLIN